MALQQIQLTNSAILSQLSLQAGYFTKHPPTNGTNQNQTYILGSAVPQDTGGYGARNWKTVQRNCCMTWSLIFFLTQCIVPKISGSLWRLQLPYLTASHSLTPMKGEALVLLGVVPVLLHPRAAWTDDLGQLAHILQMKGVKCFDRCFRHSILISFSSAKVFRIGPGPAGNWPRSPVS